MKEGFTEVTLAPRGARLHLNNEECKIYVEKASSYFVTTPGIITHNNEECVYVPQEQIYVPLQDITRLEMPVSRFTPDMKCMMLVSWDND